ncbi:hypothetical protein Taro_056571, partial [Colocasia esculenta]|nr:hypothetical protein [Colocasia esculenta]
SLAQLPASWITNLTAAPGSPSLLTPRIATSAHPSRTAPGSPGARSGVTFRDCSCDELDGKRWLAGARGKTLVCEAGLDRAENSGSSGDFREEASKGSAQIEVWQDFFHASEVVRGQLSRFEELCLSVVGLVLLL